MNLIKTSLLNGVAVAIKMLTLLGLNKVLAVYVGPAGYAAVGQFQNAVQMITAFASGAIGTGVTKYTAEMGDDPVRLHTLWRTAGSVVLIGSCTTSFAIFLFSEPLSNWAFGHSDFSGVFVLFAITLILFNLNTLLLAILNGQQEVRLYVMANIGGSVLSLVVTSVMAKFYGVYGAVAAFAIYQSLGFFVSVLLCRSAAWFSIRNFFGALDKTTLINLSKFSAMALTSAVCAPLTTLLIRQQVGDTLGWSAAGYWEAMWRLSSAYLLLVTTTLGLYFLPKLSALKEASALKKEIVAGYKVLVPIMVAAGCGIYVLRDFIIQALFTTDFSPMRELFGWQLVGDSLKMGSWILAYLILGKAMFKTYIATELLAACSYVILSYFCIGAFGLKGVGIAYALNYAMYGCLMMCCTAYYFKYLCVTANREVKC